MYVQEEIKCPEKYMNYCRNTVYMWASGFQFRLMQTAFLGVTVKERSSFCFTTFEEWNVI